MGKADDALYRAKAAGRNTYCHHSEIMEKYGTVLERSDAEIIAIDLGTTSGVKLGQEFIVFDQKLTGDTPFLLDDGRTIRQLGIYPRYSVGKIEVFDAQKRISFCTITDENFSGAVKHGARLEAIPLGTIHHHLRHALGARPISNNGTKEVLDRLARSAGKGENYILLIFMIDAFEEYAVTYGTATANRAMASLYTAASYLEYEDISTYQISPSSICLAGTAPSDTKFKDIAKQCIANFHRDFPDKPRLKIGVYSSESHPGYTPNDALESALLAVQAANPELENTIELSQETAENIVCRLKASGELSACVRDAKRLFELGYSSYILLSAAGIAAIEQGDNARTFASFFFNEAINITEDSSQKLSARLNLALAYALDAKYREAYDNFYQCIQQNSSSLTGDFQIAYAVTVANLMLGGDRRFTKDWAESQLRLALSVSRDKIKYISRLEIFKLYLDVRNIQPA